VLGRHSADPERRAEAPESGFWPAPKAVNGEAMSWTVLGGLVVVLGLCLLVLALRARELARLSQRIEERKRAIVRGSHVARLQFPEIDLSLCGGCGSCIDACPEEGVLELIHGQAAVVHGARCVGHGLCAKECPFGAIAITLGDLTGRRDIPSIAETFEAEGIPHLFLAGEVTGYALIKRAIEHGTAVASEVARRVSTPRAGEARRPGDDLLDLCIVGAGPAGLACSLEARARGLRFVTIERDSIGGAVAKYPRRKLVMTQPVDLPIVGRLDRTTYSKEELTDLWGRAVEENELPIRGGVEFLGAERDEEGGFRVRTSEGEVRARNLCLAVGRRGAPRKLGVPGEELPKVTYGLIDARSFRERDLLVVGGGDSAVECALALSARGENRVTLSYRGETFTRIKGGNEERLEKARREGGLDVVLSSEVLRIAPDHVDLAVGCHGEREQKRLPNDDVFILAGGVPPFPMLEAMGVSFDLADRSRGELPADARTGLRRALAVTLLLALGSAAWAGYFSGYYQLDDERRLDSSLHELLQPSSTLGLTFGALAVVLMLVNLAYLLRRSPRIGFSVGSLQGWMVSHLVTGVLAFLFALLHGAMQPGDTLGGHAWVGLAVLVVTGGVGRYLYSFVPRSANGRELEIDEVRRDLATVSAERTRISPAFGDRAEALVGSLVPKGRWSGSFPARIWLLVRSRRRMRRAIEELRAEGREEGLPEEQLDRFASLSLRAHRTLMAVNHLEEVRGLLQTWRWVHRWVALLVVLTLVAHLFVALRYGGILSGIS
jgi:dihydropyrimidine dehydrogenase (NAD+) subunit PreT